jgi:hypothetical protein
VSVTVRGQKVIYELDAWAARELSYILDRESRTDSGRITDQGWFEDSQDLFKAADEIEYTDE